MVIWVGTLGSKAGETLYLGVGTETFLDVEVTVCRMVATWPSSQTSLI